MVYDVLRSGYAPIPNFHLYNEEGICVFVTSDTDPETGQRHEMVPLQNRILNQNSSWATYRFTNPDLNHPVPGDTYDGADRTSLRRQR